MVASMLRMLVVLLLSGCAALSQLLPLALGVAQKGAETYFARHPNAENKIHMRAAVLALEIARLALERDYTDENRARVIAAYEQLLAILTDLGIPGAIAPPGGAETEAPLPKPFTLPSADEIANTL